MRNAASQSKNRDIRSYASFSRSPAWGSNLENTAPAHSIGNTNREQSVGLHGLRQAVTVAKDFASTSTAPLIDLEVCQTEMEDLEMCDVPEISSTRAYPDRTGPNTRTNVGTSPKQGLELQICDDGEWIEVVGSNSAASTTARRTRLQSGEAAVRRHFPVPDCDETRNDASAFPSGTESVEDFIPEQQIIENLQSLVVPRPTRPAAKHGLGGSLLGRWQIPFTKYQNWEIKKGVVVELRNGQFLSVDSIWDNHWGQKLIKGYRLVRDREHGAKLPDLRTNELVWVNEVDEEGYKVGLESVLYEEKLSAVTGARRVIFTNQPWDMLNFRNEGGANLQTAKVDAAAMEKHAQLYCRWKYVQVQSRLISDTEASISLLKYEETSDIGGLESGELRKIWGVDRATDEQGARTEVYNVDTQETEEQEQYTLGDCFCGAGGVSRGAVQAGVKVAWAFDKDASAINTHRKNFQTYGTNSMKMDDAGMISLLEQHRISADIVHYSPPCQGFSSANRHTNLQLDLLNQQVLFSLHQMTDRMKPRIVTVEETAGLMNRHRQWFDALINIFTGLGYGIRWKMVRCKDYGVPQSRLRLLLIAAAPGERLPPFPAATHGERGTGLKPFVKVGDVIYDIPPNATHQNMISGCRNLASLVPFPDNTFASCITTSGGNGNHHPSGTRNYSVRELAVLQGFPQNHEFSNEGIGVAKKQVGNAVPPPIAKLLFQEIVKSLRETDRA